ncbi:hypothetical protein SAMN05444161_0812 [Rhizobiales bacterium GAS191]|nr:hypothetical protein SAMN05444161_0812 [Rhizobiales bacterium GAS191]
MLDRSSLGRSVGYTLKVGRPCFGGQGSRPALACRDLPAPFYVVA